MSDTAPPAPGGEYTCPMHPEVVRSGRGACPRCGMALEPRAPTAEEEASPELADMSRRFWLSLALTLPLFLAAMADMAPGEPLRHALAGRALAWIELALATPVVLWGGWPLLQRGAAGVAAARPNMFTLIAIGIGTAYAYSVVAALAPHIFPPSFRGHGGEVALYFEAAAVITTLVLLGQVLELRARHRTGSAIRALLGLAPKTARRLAPDGREADVPLAHVRVGDRLRVRPGAKVPAGGIVVEGRRAVDEAVLTGEPIPLRATVGARGPEVDHGRRRTRRDRRRARQEGRGARGARAGRHAGGRQDGHADRGQAAAGVRGGRPRARRARGARPRRRPRAGERAPARRGDRRGSAGARPRAARRDGVPRPAGKGGDGHRRRACGGARQPGPPGRARDRRGRARDARRSARRRRADG